MPERIRGGYSSIPWIVVDSDAFKGASDKAKSLLLALMRQHNGKNNGRLQLNKKWLHKQGWTCPESNIKARDELIERGLVFQTRFGGLNMGLSLYALTWYSITDFTGLDVKREGYRQGAYQLCVLSPTKRRKPPKKRERLIDSRNCIGSLAETVGNLTVTSTVPKIIKFRLLPVTTTENNVITPLPCMRLLNKSHAAVRN